MWVPDLTRHPMHSTPRILIHNEQLNSIAVDVGKYIAHVHLRARHVGARRLNGLGAVTLNPFVDMVFVVNLERLPRWPVLFIRQIFETFRAQPTGWSSRSCDRRSSGLLTAADLRLCLL